MKDIKLIMAIISAVAMGACSGGSGDGGVAPIGAPTTITNPTNSYQGFDKNPSVNSGNTALTNMAAYSVTNESAVNTAMYNYVHDRLPGFGSRSGGGQRSASARNGMRDDPLPSESDIAAAVAKINEMKGILLDLTSSNVDLETYITNNRQLVAEALRLYGDDIDVANITVEDLITAFNEHEFASGAAALENFDANHTNFAFATEDLNNVDFKVVGGDDMILHFVLDEDGRIAQAGVGSGTGNSFEISPEFGWFDRDSGNVDTFSATWQKYTVALQSVLSGLTYTEGENAGKPLTLWTSFQQHGGGNGIMNPKFTRPSVVNDTDAIRTELKKQFNAEVEKFINSQPSDTPAAQIEQLRADAALLFAATLDNDTWWNAHIPSAAEADVHIAFTGLGKDVNVNGKKLKYSDFGYITKNENNKLDYEPYIGGYASRKVTTTPTSTVTYHGTAIAGLSATGAAPRLLRDDTATLTHQADTGNSILAMNNLQYKDDDNVSHDWYTMVVTTHDNAGTVDELQFHITQLIDENQAVGGNGENLKNIEDAYRWYDGAYTLDRNFVSGGALSTEYENAGIDGSEYSVGNGNTSWRGSAEANYYGENGVESEATMGFHFTEDYHPGDENDHKVSVYGAFGGVADEN